MVPDVLIQTHRRDLAELLRLAGMDLAVAFRNAGTDATIVRNRLLRLLPTLADTYGAAAAALAADWYEETRAASGITGRFRAITADLPDKGRTDALARWGVSPLFQANPDLVSARALVNGGMQRIILDADRNTIRRSTTRDPRGVGYARNVSGQGCDFCRMLAGRGAVYRADTADFKSHDNCGCVAVPVYDVDLTDTIDLRDTADITV